jgi:site-specific DNA recombinase
MRPAVRELRRALLLLGLRRRERAIGYGVRGRLRGFGTTGSGRNRVPLARALAEQDMLRDAAEGIIAGDTLRGLCRDWNRDKVPTAQNAKWTASILRRTLLSPRIAGYREHHGKLYPSEENQARLTAAGYDWRNFHAGEWHALIPNEWVSILPVETWMQVHAILTDPTRTTRKGGDQPRHLLTGLIYCGVCGKRLYCRTPATKAAIRAYYCHDATGVGGHVHRNAAKVEELICEALFRAVENPEWDKQASERAKDDPTRPILERLALDQARLDGLDAKEDEALQLELDGELDKAKRLTATIGRLRTKYETEMQSEREAYARLQGDRVMAHVPRNLRQVWPDLSLDRRRSILAAVFRRLGKRVVIFPQKRERGPHFDVNAVRLLPVEWTPETPA